MELYAAIYNDTDGCTYWCEIILAICDSQEKADDIILKEVESGEYPWREFADYDVRVFNLNEKW